MLEILFYFRMANFDEVNVKGLLEKTGNIN